MPFSYPYEPIFDRPALRWPEGKTVAVVLTMNMEVFTGPDTIAQYAGLPRPRNVDNPNRVAEAYLEYGVRVGAWRIIRLLDELGVKVSTHLNSDLIAAYPALAGAIRDRGWEIAAHSTNQDEPLSMFFGNVEGERAHIRRVRDTIGAFFGSNPVGWVSPGAGTTPESIQLLKEEGFQWFGDWSNDDQPFDVTTDAGPITCIPYNFDINDIIHFQREMLTADDFRQKIEDQYRVLDAEGRESGRLLTIGVHPYLLGRPFRYVALEQALRWLQQQPGAWFAHRSDILAAWRQRGS